ncbi:UNVERIFIED_CONTAM: hypothetical protein Sindi_1031000, partial [Sesamum indicum]
MDLNTNEMFIARDVIFHEGTFFFHNVESDNSVCPLPTSNYEEEDIGQENNEQRPLIEEQPEQLR